MANSSSGSNARFIGWPISHETSTSRGATTSDIWIAEPTQMLNTMLIRSWRPKATAANRSAEVPTSASTIIPRKAGETCGCVAVASTASETSSASAAISTVPPISTPS